MWNRTSNLPACSVLSQPSAPLRAHFYPNLVVLDFAMNVFEAHVSSVEFVLLTAHLWLLTMVVYTRIIPSATITSMK